MRGSADRANPDRQYLHLLAGVVFQPVFIMGGSRTGTTMLYNMLGATQCFNIVTVYHVIKYDEIVHNYLHHTDFDCKRRLDALFRRQGWRDRGLDHIQLSSDMPEEFRHVLENSGYSSRLTQHNLAMFVELCRKVQFTSDSTQPLLLKNPWDSLNFMYIKREFPGSKFIFIHRHPTRTINSQLKTARYALRSKIGYLALANRMYDKLFDQPIRLGILRLLVSSHFHLGLSILTRLVAHARNSFLKRIPLLSQSDYISLRYEDLCREPRPTVTNIADWLGLKANARIDYESLIDVRTGSLLSEVERNREWIFEKMKPYFEYCGYDLEGVRSSFDA